MSYLSILVLAFALSIDACLVSFSYGIKYNKNKLKNALLLSSSTGIFQGIMPVLGYYMTNVIKIFIQPYTSLIVFFIFSYLGIKFIIEALQKEKEKHLCINIKSLILIGIATSIDAFSAGISLSLYGNRIIKPIILIGLITFLNSNLGFLIGSKLKYLPTKYIESLAGLLLIILGIKAII